MFKVGTHCAEYRRRAFVWQVSSVTDSCLLSRPTNAQHTYINNIVYIESTATCFDAPTSSSGFAKVTKSIKPAD